MNLRDYKGKDVSAAQLQVECTTTADVFDVEGNVLATIHWQGNIPMDNVAYIRLNGDGVLYKLEITGWGEYYWSKTMAKRQRTFYAPMNKREAS